eukprot:CAMPEP_0174249934 /NCGR_PEP_ID=MMETSP0439-20130205/253_1 /TAXON_ID=0 /ORGANISM="Stereomyxa ramosa, Strain Chinc5" /LENGTH=163 /DNA_ID=CAMNT_0015329879 /DNA_START=84 /DNA_END=575 /DNA_ORIENTATION=+
MVFLVEVEIRESPMHGKGVFAKQDIKKGTIVWRFSPETCKIVPVEELEKFNPTTEEEEEELFGMLWYGYLNEKTYSWFIAFDGSQYTNHSTEPNIGYPEESSSHPDREVEEEVCIALEDIKEGEEFTADYRAFGCIHDGRVMKLLRERCLGGYEFEMFLHGCA